MRLPVRGLVPPHRYNCARPVRLMAFGLIGAALSGCATQQAPQYAGVQPVHPISERQWKAEVEEDGRPAQAPPVRRMRPEEDDPTQPWSPNYGKGVSDGAKPVTPTAPARASMPPLVETSASAPSNERQSRRLSAHEADTVILRAIQNHETRRP